MSDLSDALIRHSVFIQRLIPSISKDVIKNIDSNNDELFLELTKWLDNNDVYKLTEAQQRQIDTLIKKISKTRGAAIQNSSDAYNDQMIELGTKEQAFVAKTILEETGITLVLASTSSMERAVTYTPYDGATLAQTFSSLADSDAKRIVSEVQQGLSAGQTESQIRRRIFGTKKLDQKDGILQVTRNSINKIAINSGIVRTIITGVINSSRQQLFLKNDIEKYEIIATLDGRTTPVCRSEDGNIYETGKGPIPPFHINCRTAIAPYFHDGIETERPAITDTRTPKQRNLDFKKESRETGESVKDIRQRWKNKNISQVPSDTTYQKWLTEQTPAFQKEVLGKTKSELFRNGELTLDRFVDPTGKEYTIPELYSLNRDAFRKAGIPKPKSKR